MLKIPLKYLLVLVFLAIILIAGAFLPSQFFKKEKPALEPQYTYLSEPKLSINNKITYVKGNNLFAADINGHNIRQLTNYPAIENTTLHESEIKDFEWSPDGKKIIYLKQLDGSQQDKQKTQLSIIDITKNQIINEMTIEDSNAHWLDDKSIVINEPFYTPRTEQSSSKTYDRFYIADIYSGSKKLIKEKYSYLGMREFNLSYDQQYLAFTSLGGVEAILEILNVTKDNAQLIDHNHGEIINPKWSLSGQYLAYEVGTLASIGFVNIYDIKDNVNLEPNPEGGYLGETKSFDVSSYINKEIYKGRGMPNFNTYYDRWLNNDKLLFMTYGESDKGDDEIDIWTIGPKGENLEKIGGFTVKETGSNPRWHDVVYGITISYDLKKVIFKKAIGETEYKKQAIYSINIDGSDLKKIVNNAIKE